MLLLYNDYLTKGISIVDNKHRDKLRSQLEKHFFSLKQDIFPAFTYVSPSTSSYFKHHDIFFEVEKDYQNCKSFGDIIITGDFNARTKTDDDYNFDEEDRFLPLMI